MTVGIKGIIFSSTLKICFLNLNALVYEVIHQIGHFLHCFSLEGKTVKSKVERNYYKNLLLWRQHGFENSTFHWFFHSCFQRLKLWIIQSDGYFRSLYSLMTKTNKVLTFIPCRNEITHSAHILLSCFWMNIMCKGKVKMEAYSKSEHGRIIHFCFCFEDSSEKRGEKMTDVKMTVEQGDFFLHGLNHHTIRENELESQHQKKI